MILIDSSGWIEFFTEGPRLEGYIQHFAEIANIITPTIVVYEVYRKIRKNKTEEDALLAVSLMNRTFVVDLTESIALSAADLSLQHGLPAADSIVYATALESGCQVVTNDNHFRGLPHVLFVP